MKLKVRGGNIGFMSAYAPHNLRPHDERQQFYCDLGCIMDKCSTNGPAFLFEDFNSKLGMRRPGEEDILGPCCYGLEASHKVEDCNRNLLMEFCTDRSFVVVNTFTET